MLWYKVNFFVLFYVELEFLFDAYIGVFLAKLLIDVCL